MYNEVEVKAILIAVHNIENVGLNSKKVLLNSIEWLRCQYEITQDESFLIKAVWHIYAYLELGYPYISGELEFNRIGSIYSCNNQIYLINSMVRYYDEANDSFGALTSCPEWLMTIKDNKLKKLCELPDGLNISSFLLTDRGIICVSCAGAAVYRLSENGKYEETNSVPITFPPIIKAGIRNFFSHQHDSFIPQ